MRDVRVIERRGELCFVEEQPHELRVLGVARQDLLQDDELLEPFRTDRAREEELRHPAAGELAHDFIRPEPRGLGPRLIDRPPQTPSIISR